MNIFAKLYCRSFQTIFKIALPFMPYRNPKILRKPSQISKVLKAYGIYSVIIVTDKTIIEHNLLSRILKALNKASIKYTIFDKTVPNPTVQNVEDALNLYKQHQCDAIIAVGGGSSIDCAKGLGVRIAMPHTPLDKLQGILKVHKKLPPIIAVPTTAGTGSEATLAAVISDPWLDSKYVIMSFPLIPRFAYLDPSLTISLPKRITAETGIDAMCHAIEAYIGNSTTKGTRTDALIAMNLLYSNIDKAYNDGTDLEARQAMLEGSYFAGCAFTRSYVGYVHAIAHAIGGKYNLPHGRVVAIILPYVLKAYGSVIDQKLKDIAVEIGLVEEDCSAANAAIEFIKALIELENRFDIPKSIDCLVENDIDELATTAAKEANPLYPVPVLWDKEKIASVISLLLPN